MSSAARTVLAIPFHKNAAQFTPFLSNSVSGVWKTGFSYFVSETCSFAAHDDDSLSLTSHDILYAFIISIFFFLADAFSML
jgi:hypothetical protein